MKPGVVSQRDALLLPSDQDASGRNLGNDELSLLEEVIRSGRLTSTTGSTVRALEHSFAAALGVHYVYACSSGTASVHTAVAAIDPEPGDEIVTSPITDMGALTPILYQGAIPMFADVDPQTCHVTAATIEPCLSPRTRAIIVTHLFGNPCSMGEIMDLARTRGIPVIEDCAQAYLAKCAGRLVGTIGDIACFSLQQGKHMTSGEGGLVVTDNEAYAERMLLFINKAWGYGEIEPDHHFLALNYRMSELQGAVALAQLRKLPASVGHRIRMAQELGASLRNVAGIATPSTAPDSVHSYWKYCLRVDRGTLPQGVDVLAQRLREKGIASAPRYIKKPAFMCEVFQKQRTFGQSRYPFTLAREEALNYDPERFPGVFAGLEDLLVLPWNERYTGEHVDCIARFITETVERLRRERG